MAEKLVLYGDYMSQPSRAILCFCKITGIELKLKIVSPLSGDQFKKEFKNINPMKQVPVLVETVESDPQSRLVISESHTILRYLATK